MTVLVVAAHPDDEVLGCGGTIARLSQEGAAVHIVILGEGITARYAGGKDAADGEKAAGAKSKACQTQTKAIQTELKTLHARACKAGKLLGAKDVRVMDLPDNRFDTVPMLEIVKKIEAVIDELQPEMVFTQHGGDLNVDHVQTYRATLTATRTMKGCPVKTLYAYEVASSTEWAFQKFAPPFHPNVFFDISRTLDKKLAAMRVYESESRPFPHPRSSEALRAAAIHWGSVAGLGAAEAFELVREIR